MIWKRFAFSLCIVSSLLTACGAEQGGGHQGLQTEDAYKNLTAPLPKGPIATFGNKLTLSNNTTLVLKKNQKPVWSETKKVKKLSFAHQSMGNIYLAECVGTENEAYLIGFRKDGKLFLNKSIGNNTTFHFISPREVIFETRTGNGKLYLQDMRIRSDGSVETMITKDKNKHAPWLSMLGVH